jgi:hypothetical protein
MDAELPVTGVVTCVPRVVLALALRAALQFTIVAPRTGGRMDSQSIGPLPALPGVLQDSLDAWISSASEADLQLM